MMRNIFGVVIMPLRPRFRFIQRNTRNFICHGIERTAQRDFRG